MTEDRNHRAQLISVLDQASAAHQDAKATLESWPGREGRSRPGPITARMIDEMRDHLDELADADGIWCEHGHPRGPRPLYWLPWDGLLRCETCTDDTIESVEGTEDQFRCDNCDRVVQRLYRVATLLPPQIISLADEPIWAMSPITILAHLCEGCGTADRPDLNLSARGHG